MFRILPIQVGFPQTPLDVVDVEKLTVRTEVGRMDVARLNTRLSYDDIYRYVTAGSPLWIKWGRELRSDVFYGYVHSFRPKVDGYQRSTEIIAVSAAYPMFNESGKTYYSVGIDNVAQEIGDEYRFQVETDPHPVRQSQILQQTDSDWGLLARLGEQWGYVLMMDGVTLIFRSLIDLLEEKFQSARMDKTYTYTRTAGAHILSFESTYSAARGTPLSATVLQGVNPVDVQPITRRVASIDKDVFDEIDSRAVSSELEGEQKGYAAAVQRIFPYRAKATILAPFRLRPFDVYRIIDDGTPMTWTALSIKHEIGGDRYTAEVEFGSDGIDHVGVMREGEVNISLLLKRNKRVRRPEPIIINSRPYYVGTGANAVVNDQRWKARLMTVPMDDREAS